MNSEDTAYYSAYSSRDPRFDGVFYIGVTSTRIYCRPVCPARTPRQSNCRFFKSREAAEKASFRPCLRCRPELAPGSAPIDDAQRIAHLIITRLHEPHMDADVSLESLASEHELSSRQLRRICQKELGVSPMELVKTRRLLLAKQLLTDTSLPITDIAFASGFSSVRRFNDAFRTHYNLPPSRLRKGITSSRSSESSPMNTFSLDLSYRPPLDWRNLLEFLKVRCLKGVESVDGQRYARTVSLGSCTGVVCIEPHASKYSLVATLSHSLLPVLPSLLARLRSMFDLDAHPQAILAALSKDDSLARSISSAPGLRVPGTFDGFELAIRAILGQQVSVKAATTLAGRFVSAFGKPFRSEFPELSFLSPTAERIATLKPLDLSALGIIERRAQSIIAIARAIAAGDLSLQVGIDPEAAIQRLTAIPGIGSWTAHYIAMRALRWADAFPKEDIVLRKHLGGITSKVAEARSEMWRPWRSYATMHLWHSGSNLQRL